MKAKLWEIYARHKNPSYFADKHSLTVNARTLKEALHKAEKHKDLKDYIIYKIEWLASED